MHKGVVDVRAVGGGRRAEGGGRGDAEGLPLLLDLLVGPDLLALLAQLGDTLFDLLELRLGALLLGLLLLDLVAEGVELISSFTPHTSIRQRYVSDHGP